MELHLSTVRTTVVYMILSHINGKCQIMAQRLDLAMEPCCLSPSGSELIYTGAAACTGPGLQAESGMYAACNVWLCCSRAAAQMSIYAQMGMCCMWYIPIGGVLKILESLYMVPAAARLHHIQRWLQGACHVWCLPWQFQDCSSRTALFN